MPEEKDNLSTKFVALMQSPDYIKKSLFTIGEVAQMLEVNPSLIRFWEKEFKQLTPRKTAGGTRKFSEEDIHLLKKIHYLVKIEGYTLQGAKEQLKAGTKEATISDIKEKLFTIKSFLTQLKEHIKTHEE